MSNYNNNEEIKTYKLITLGDSGVGKTAILRRFISGKFEQNTLSAIGFETSTKDIVLKGGTKIRLQLIDTAGQENYRALTTSYIRNADGALFIFSHNNKESFYNIKKWLDSFRNNNHGDDFTSYLVGNKCDLEHVIDEAEIEKLKNENIFSGYCDTSAKTDIGITNLFYKIGEMLIKTKGKVVKRQKMVLARKKKKKQKCLCQEV